MTIQPSIILWTVICFTLLLLILKNWLFEPVLRVMDARRERIAAARHKKETREQNAIERKNAAEREAAEYAERIKAENSKKAEQIQQEGKKKIQTAQKDRLKKVNAYREQMENDYSVIVGQVSPEMEKAARLFADVIIENRI